jgi:hypothetical protein
LYTGISFRFGKKPQLFVDLYSELQYAGLSESNGIEKETL